VSLTIGRAGLDAAMRRLDTAAWDIARASNAQAASPPAGPQATVPAPGPAAQPAPAPAVAGPWAQPAPGDLPAQMIGLMTASHAVMANLQVIRRADEAMRALVEPR
jgi:hypothetical protein